MDNKKNNLIFPAGFFWGCATSAHQIEGGLLNDWTEWEKSPKRLANLKKKQEDPIDFISGVAANSYVENNADIACLKELNNNAYRFSLDWSRLEPEEGKFNIEALEYYKDFIKKLRAQEIEPFITIWHWPIPFWLRDKGGWKNKIIVDYFKKFTEKVGNYLNEEVNFWITLNEPMIYASQSYLIGEWPPQKRNIFSFLKVINNLAAAHRESYQILKLIDANNKVGIAKHNIYYESAGGIINNTLKKFIDWFQNFRFLNKIKDHQDFIGLNYYFHNYISYGLSHEFSYKEKSDIGWGLHPEGIYYVLKDLKKYNKPVYITENGLADQGDQHRSWYIEEILKNVHHAISEGVAVKGYFHWSLIDNFEWSQGFKPRFGLYEVNYQTYERVGRSSAEFYADICKNNRI